MITESEIRDQIFDVLTNRKSVSDLQFWLVDKAWNPEVDSALSAADLAADLELHLAEYSRNDLTRAELLDKFRGLISIAVADVTISDHVSMQRRGKITSTNSASHLVSPGALTV